VRLAEAAKAVIDWVEPDFIDLNFGCPVNKVVSRNGGSSLLRDCPLLKKVAAAVVTAAGPVPVTAKIRIGWDSKSVNALETARILEGEGITRLAIHGRTKEQGYTGKADWAVIAAVAACAQIPVIGNGDVDSPETAIDYWKKSGVAGLMIGRAAMHHPWIFREIRMALEGGDAAPLVGLREKWDFIVHHAELENAWSNGHEELAMKSMRSRLMAYTRGLPGGARLRERLQHVESLDGLREIAAEHSAAHNECGEKMENLCAIESRADRIMTHGKASPR
jgi:tRNA-dihydrouridine synthase B